MLAFLIDLFGPVLMTVFFTATAYLMVYERNYQDLMWGFVGFLFSAFVLFLCYSNGNAHLLWTVPLGLVIGIVLWATGVYARLMPKEEG